MVTRRQEGATEVANATERSPSTVPAGATRDGKTPGRYAWVEPTIWTPRMVQALQNGVKGGRWYSALVKHLTPKHGGPPLGAAWRSLGVTG